MGSVNAPFYSLNSGVVGAEALGRIDVAKMRVAAEVQTNLLPRVLGPAQFRPGTAYHARTRGDLDARLLPFTFNVETKALLELTSGVLRPILDGVPLTRPAVTAAVANGNFDTDLTGWTDADEAGAVSSWATGGYLNLNGSGDNFAMRQQQVTVNEPGVEHALRIHVNRGSVTLKVGTAAGLDDYIAETELRTGYHSIAFTPTGNFHITLAGRPRLDRRVSSIQVEGSGEVEIPTPWTGDDIWAVRHDQSGDVLFCACEGIQQTRIERRSQRSWSVVDYAPDDGPFRAPNFSATTIAASDVQGNPTLTASRAIFDASHVGALWRLTTYGQTVQAELAGADQYTAEIRITGVGDTRKFTVEIAAGPFVGTITLQRSFAEPGSWEDVTTYTTTGTSVVSDGFDNQIIYYRLGFKTGDYTSGSPNARMVSSTGIQDGIVRITEVTSGTVASAEVLATLGKDAATSDWAEGEWSDYRGFPGSVRFHDGRLWWGWRDRVFGSVSDGYDSFDQDTEGDSAPIVRSVATGGFEDIHWLVSLQRLLAGTGAQEVSIRSSSFDEPLTPTAFTARAASNRGSARIQAVTVDSRAIYVQRSGKRVFELLFSVEAQDYTSQDLTRLCPDICLAGIRDIAVQRQPDTRIWFVLDDGTCAVLTFEASEDANAWTPVETSTGSRFKAVTALPGDLEDEVWFVVERPVDGTTRHYIEKLARLDECVGGALNKTMDAHLAYSGASTTSITGLGHLNGQQVVVWGNGAPIVTADAPLTVSAGAVTLPSAVTNAVVGLPYEGRFKSAKLAHAAQAGSALLMKKRVSRLGLLMRNVSVAGVRIGRDFSNMTGLSALFRGRALAADEVLEEYDETLTSFPGGWSTDSRVCFSIESPHAATFLGMVVALETNEGLSVRPASAEAK